MVYLPWWIRNVTGALIFIHRLRESIFSRQIIVCKRYFGSWSCFDSASLFKGKKAKISSGTFLSWPNMTSRAEIDGCFRSGNRAPKKYFGKKMKRRQRQEKLGVSSFYKPQFLRFSHFTQTPRQYTRSRTLKDGRRNYSRIGLHSDFKSARRSVVLWNKRKAKWLKNYTRFENSIQQKSSLIGKVWSAGLCSVSAWRWRKRSNRAQYMRWQI